MRRLHWRVLLAAVSGLPLAAHAADGKAWIAQVDQRVESPWQTATMELSVTPKGGTAQLREAAAFSHFTAERRETALYFRTPGAMKKTAFLSVDGTAAGADEQWLFLPALQTVRRVPGSSRGGSFLGTDLSYGDVQRVGKVGLDDYQFADPGKLPNGLIQVSGTATPLAAAELGHAKAQWTIDPRSLFIVEARYLDARGATLKQVWVSDIEQVGGFWTARTIRVQNPVSGSETTIRFRDLVFGQPFDATILSSKGLQSGKGLK
jgi:hypothetical protein